MYDSLGGNSDLTPNESGVVSGLEKELENVARNVSTLSKSGDEFAEQEDQIADQISTMKQRLAKLMVDGKDPSLTYLHLSGKIPTLFNESYSIKHVF